MVRQPDSSQNFFNNKGGLPANISIDSVREEFRETEKRKLLSCYNLINESFYWRPGEYYIIIEVSMSKDDRKFEYNYKFSLSDAESEKIKLNIIGLIEAALHAPPKFFNFANPKLERA